jgi:hypothetical protein
MKCVDEGDVMRTKIATVLIVFLLLTPLAVVQPRGEIQNQEEIRVGAFYYEWYNGTGSLNCPNSGHWNGAPWWSVEDTPTIGYYNSCDPASVYNQLDEMSAAGINFLIVSWWEWTHMIWLNRLG